MVLEKTMVDTEKYCLQSTPESTPKSDNTARMIIERDPDINGTRLSKQETARLEFLRRLATSEINIDAKLLTISVGTMVVLVNPGASERSPISMTHVLRDYISHIKARLYKERSLRTVHEVALVKLLAIRMGRTTFLCQNTSTTRYSSTKRNR